MPTIRDYRSGDGEGLRTLWLASELVRRAEAGLRDLGCPRALVNVEAGNGTGTIK